MIGQFSVKNFKALESVTIPLTVVHVLIGQNDSGKTSLLEAIHAFCGSTQGSLPDAFPGSWVGRELVRFESECRHVELSARLVSDDFPSLDYEFGVDFPLKDQRVCRMAFERLSVFPEASRDISSVLDGGEWEDLRFHPRPPRGLRPRSSIFPF